MILEILFFSQVHLFVYVQNTYNEIMFICLEFVTACRYPILCDITVDDDVDSTCIGIPGKVPATSPRPPFSSQSLEIEVGALFIS